jgi:hypothetical protein
VSEEQVRIERIALGNEHRHRKGWTCAKCKTLKPCAVQRLLADLSTAERDRERLRESLLSHGKHHSSCPQTEWCGNRCTCGLAADLEVSS